MKNIIYTLLLFISLFFIILKLKPLYLFDEKGHCRSLMITSIIIVLLLVWCYLFVIGLNEKISLESI